MGGLVAGRRGPGTGTLPGAVRSVGRIRALATALPPHRCRDALPHPTAGRSLAPTPARSRIDRVARMTDPRLRRAHGVDPPVARSARCPIALTGSAGCCPPANSNRVRLLAIRWLLDEPVSASMRTRAQLDPSAPVICQRSGNVGLKRGRRPTTTVLGMAGARAGAVDGRALAASGGDCRPLLVCGAGWPQRMPRGSTTVCAAACGVDSARRQLAHPCIRPVLPCRRPRHRVSCSVGRLRGRLLAHAALPGFGWVRFKYCIGADCPAGLVFGHGPRHVQGGHRRAGMAPPVNELPGAEIAAQITRYPVAPL